MSWTARRNLVRHVALAAWLTCALACGRSGLYFLSDASTDAEGPMVDSGVQPVDASVGDGAQADVNDAASGFDGDSAYVVDGPTEAAPVVVGCVGAPGLQPDSPWPIARRCPSRAGYTTAVGPAAPRIAWQKNAPSLWDSDLVVAADGTAYAHDRSQGVIAIASDGGTVWTAATNPGGSPTWLAIGADGTVFAWNGVVLTAVHPDGSSAWSAYPTGGQPADPVFPLTVGPDGTIYVSGAGALWAVAPSGSTRWYRPVGTLCGPPAIGTGGTIYLTGLRDECWVDVFTPTGVFAASDPLGDLGALQTPGVTTVGPMVDPYGTVYAPCEGGLCSFAAGGQPIASFTAGAASAPSAVSPSGRPVYASDGATLYAIDPSSGQVVWSRPASLSALVDGRGTVFTAVGGADGGITEAVDGTGHVIWTVGAGYPVAIGADGTLYCVPGTAVAGAPIVAISP